MSALVDVRELLGELEEQPVAIRQVLGALLRELTRAQSGVAEVAQLREEFDAYKEEVCELRSALDSERLERASLEWRLDNLAEDFGDLVGVLREQGLVPQVPDFEAAKRCVGASGLSQIGEPLAGASSVGAKNFNEGKGAEDE